jgi:hypothetical protein
MKRARRRRIYAAAWDLGCDFLGLEEEVCGTGAERVTRAAPVARGERQTQTADNRPFAGPARSAEDRAKSCKASAAARVG